MTANAPPASDAGVPLATTGPDRALWCSEAVVLTGGLGLALVATSSLLLADLSVHSLASVALVTLAAAAVVAVLVGRLPGRPAVRVDPGGLATIAGVGVLAAVLSFPGFPFAISKQDPGIYVVHAQAIAREGSTTIDDEVLEAGLPYRSATPGARFGGLWIDEHDPTAITPQFFHLYPALLATAFEVAGSRALVNVNAALAVLAAMAVALSVRRAFGMRAGLVAGVLLSTGMLQVWQAKFPTTEMLAQALLAVAILAAAVSLETRWGPPAALSGFLVSVGFLARPDGLLLVIGAVVVVAVIAAVAGFDRRLGWFCAGLALPLPLAVGHAWYRNLHYSQVNGLPSMVTTGAVVLAVGLGALLWRTVLHGRVAAGIPDDRRPDRRRVELAAGVLLAVAAALFLAFCWFRGTLIGQDFLDYRGRPIRSFDEQNLRRLGWFVTLPGLLLVWLGVVTLGLRRWRAVQWLVVLPGACLLPLYLWAARISPHLMWWGRRFVPAALVGIVILMAVALDAAFGYRGRRWPVASGIAGLVLCGIVAVYLHQSSPLRAHRELAGSSSVVDRVVSHAGPHRGVFLWAPTDGSRAAPNDVGAAVWFAHDHISALLPAADKVDTVQAYQDAFPDSPVFVVTSNGEPAPDALVGDLVEVDHIVAQLPLWAESTEFRPSAPGRPFSVDFRVWRVARPGESAGVVGS